MRDRRRRARVAGDHVGGPGGQHANRSLTAVEVRLDIAESRSLGPRQRARLLERIGPVARASASERRSQARNRELALERLCARLAAALHVDAPRRPTAPTRRARAQRLGDKRRRGESKQLRRRPTADD
ncbi:MAG: aminoacyl-tRNA hydrolase [Acidimicrobiia bacterium]|nr:aminoacyl-tRNA hydrolase [Acidimicrobiia bacterium]